MEKSTILHSKWTHLKSCCFFNFKCPFLDIEITIYQPWTIFLIRFYNSKLICFNKYFLLIFDKINKIFTLECEYLTLSQKVRFLSHQRSSKNLYWTFSSFSVKISIICRLLFHRTKWTISFENSIFTYLDITFSFLTFRDFSFVVFLYFSRN